MPGLRVAYVLGTTSGGTGQHVAMLAGGCARAGLAVHVLGPPPFRPFIDAVMPPPGATTAHQAQGQPGVGRIGYDCVVIADHPRPARDVATVRRIRRLLAGFGPHAVHAHGMRAGAMAALAIGPYPGMRWPGRRPRLIVTVHNAPAAGTASAVVYRLLERLVARRADAVLCVSGDLAERMKDLGARDVSRAVVPAPSLRISSPGRTVKRVASSVSGRPVVVAAGRLVRQKGFDILLEAAARWRARKPEPIVLLAGAGPDAADLAIRARELRVAAEFLGQRDDVPALLASADVVVLPSRWEGQPMVLQEALAAGRPVVATDVGGVSELAGGAALLVPPDDPAALAEAVISVLDDPDFASELARSAAARAATLPGEPEAVAAVVDLYRRLTQ